MNEKATLLIARQQPVASDLRKIIVAFKVSSDLERIGDLAVDICKAGERIHPFANTNIDTDILVQMANTASEMLTKALKHEDGNVQDA
ncbi:hypothetical protein KHA80_17255 [Anaerobacillus sp. HL2]|nr:hypothetical protein KHA80_17255 [Anaerobacillus sp. HL2]